MSKVKIQDSAKLSNSDMLLYELDFCTYLEMLEGKNYLQAVVDARRLIIESKQ